MARIITIDLPSESVEFNEDEVIVTEREHGIAVQPKRGQEIGFLRQFFPWQEVRRVTTKDA